MINFNCVQSFLWAIQFKEFAVLPNLGIRYWDIQIPTEFIKNASITGNLKILQWLQINRFEIDSEHFDYYYHHKFLPRIKQDALKFGFIHVLDWLATMKKLSCSLYADAAKYGRLDSLQYLYDRNFHPDEHCMREISLNAARYHQSPVIEWMEKNGTMSIDHSEIFTEATINGSIEFLYWLLDHHSDKTPPYVYMSKSDAIQLAKSHLFRRESDEKLQGKLDNWR